MPDHSSRVRRVERELNFRDSEARKKWPSMGFGQGGLKLPMPRPIFLMVFWGAGGREGSGKGQGGCRRGGKRNRTEDVEVGCTVGEEPIKTDDIFQVVVHRYFEGHDVWSSAAEARRHGWRSRLI